MKYILILSAILLASCAPKLKPSATTSYYVYKVDSINTYYLIYAKKNDSLYKIVSKKESVGGCSEIKEKNSYDFKLKSLLKNRFKNTSFPKPMGDANITCFTFEDDTQICKEKDIFDLYFADNLKGLCLTNQ